MTTKTIKELAEELTHFDEVSVLELLDIDATELVERFMDKVARRYVFLRNKVDGQDDYEEALEEVLAEQSNLLDEFSWGFPEGFGNDEEED